ncbi:aldolase [Moritella sp. 24]|uniref:aldolase/citrate lyase family protein n=1 Tax=Moritella sp. 24 TaxID=2746230 RepID=UPI001BA9B557|nr:aldolase/citrate lyase family protein [Moritella sp. 24]QUM77869.1 aldolase [Moritella sp. 24]
MFNLMLITNDVDLAKHAVDAGISRIFVDLEVNGKFERQGHLDTLISKHSIQDARHIRNVIGEHELLIRLNPLYDGSELEVEQAISAGADLLMLPMFTTAEQVNSFCRLIAGRAKCIPLVETAAAAACLADVVKVEGVSEIYIGLNDLHLDLKLNFMFEPLANGLLESLINIVKDAGLPFGFGGMARIGEGTLPAELILAEHVRLGSSCVILSRAFHHKSESLVEFKSVMNLENEVSKIMDTRTYLLQRNEAVQLADKTKVIDIINSIIASKH